MHVLHGDCFVFENLTSLMINRIQAFVNKVTLWLTVCYEQSVLELRGSSQ
jgi:uncharacterized protein YlzI (FlbEa/FlbD family)